MRSLALLAVLPALLLTGGCGKSQSEDNDDDLMHRIEARSEEQALKIAQGGTVYCASSNSSDCSPSVGMLTSISGKTHVGECTAFLVSPQVAVTNSHCIPADLKSPGSACANRIWMYFPDLKGFSQIRTGCSQVLTASSLPEEYDTVPDYAVIQLDQPVNRPTLEISRDGFADGSAYQILKVDPQSDDAAIGAMKRETCRAVHDSFLVRGSADDESANMLLGDCDVIEGNSGSPLVDSHGKVHGLIQMTIDKEDLETQLVRLGLQVLDSGIAEVGGGTNFGCLDLPAEIAAAPRNARCSSLVTTDQEKYQKNEWRLLQGKIDKGIQLEFNRVEEELNPAIKWKLAEYKDPIFGALPSSQAASYKIPVPSCIRDMNALLKNHKGSSGSYDMDAELGFSIPKFGVSVGVNRYIVPDYRLEASSSSISAELSYNPQELATNGTAKFAVSQINYLGLKDELYSNVIGACSGRKAN